MVGITVLMMDDGGLSGSRFTKSICGSLWLLHDLLPGRGIWKGTFLRFLRVSHVSLPITLTKAAHQSPSRVALPLALPTRVSGHLASRDILGFQALALGNLVEIFPPWDCDGGRRLYVK